MSVIILVADGARPDTLAAAMDAGELPALAQIRDEGAFRTITSAFPSVTGPAYAPFLMGRFPGPVGLPGLRWYDRARLCTSFPHHTRSYVGSEMRKVDRDLDPTAPTLFELAPPSLGALNMIGRGLSAKRTLARSAAFAVRVGYTHFRGDVRGWLAIDRDVGDQVARRIRRDRPAFVFAALTGIDKTSHAVGHDAPLVREAMRIVNDTAATIRADAERDGRWRDMHLWVVSDHGHSRVSRHEDLERVVSSWGHRVVAHPWIYSVREPDVAVMVSGNAMAHVYLELERRKRPWWPELSGRWEETATRLLGRESVDLLVLAHSPDRCEVRGRGRGAAIIERRGERYSYSPTSGDPLGTGELTEVTSQEAYDATIGGDYPDGIVQLAHLAGAGRSGEMILSASRDWDFRARYEPIPHVSSHGALHREHMLVPLLVNRPPGGTPRRTADVMPSALTALGLSVPPGLDGRSFVRGGPDRDGSRGAPRPPSRSRSIGAATTSGEHPGVRADR